MNSELFYRKVPMEIRLKIASLEGTLNNWTFVNFY